MKHFTPQSRLISLADASVILGVSRSTVRRMVEQGQLPHTKLAERTLRVRLVDVERIVEGCSPNAQYQPEPAS